MRRKSSPRCFRMSELLTSSADWQSPASFPVLVCRPALPKDTPDVIELTRTIWEGEDYVPSVWPTWLADPCGLLAVGEYGPRVVGLVKLTCLGQGEWWLEGLRVHPAYEGRGFASHLHDYVLDYWIRNGASSAWLPPLFAMLCIIFVSAPGSSGWVNSLHLLLRPFRGRGMDFICLLKRKLTKLLPLRSVLLPMRFNLA